MLKALCVCVCVCGGGGWFWVWLFFVSVAFTRRWHPVCKLVCHMWTIAMTNFDLPEQNRVARTASSKLNKLSLTLAKVLFY